MLGQVASLSRRQAALTSSGVETAGWPVPGAVPRTSGSGAGSAVPGTAPDPVAPQVPARPHTAAGPTQTERWIRVQPAPAMSLEWSATAGRERRESRQHSMARVGKRRRKRHRPSASSAAASPQTSSSGDRINTEPHHRQSLRKRIAVSRRLYSRQALAVSTLCALAIVSYIPAISGGFVWDDVIFTEEPIIREASGLWRIWFSPSDIDREGHYWPIVYTSFWLDHKLWDLSPIGCHAVNVLLHLVNCLLLWRLMLRLAVPGAWFIAAVFAVHPLHVESVAWVIERKDLLSALFYLSAALTWIRFTATPRLPTYLLALALFVAGLLSKSIVVTLPVALLIWHWWKRGRVTSADLLRLLPLFVIALCITAADLAFYRGKDPLTFDLSLIERVLIAARALWFYAGKLVWPVDLPVIYPRWEMDASHPLEWGYLAAAVALVALLWFVRKWVGTAPLVGASYFALTLSPVLGFVDFSYMEFSFVADRYQYLAGIGLTAVLVGAAALQASKLQGKSRMVAQGIAGAVLILLAAKTWMQAGIYKNQVTFFSHVVARNPQAKDAYFNLGNALLREGRPEDSLAASRIAVEQRPDSAKAYSNLSVALQKLGRLEEAQAQLARARELDPGEKSALHNTAELLRKQGRYEEALQWYREALAIDPDYALAHAGMGDTLVRSGRFDEALEAMSMALSLNPDLPEQMALSLHRSMGTAFEKLGRLDEAAQAFGRVLEVDPQDVSSHLDLASLRGRQQRFEEADRHLRRARELRPGDAETLLKIAERLRLGGRNKEALEAFHEVLEISPEHPPAFAGIGLALYEMNRYDEAIEAMAKALSLRSELPIAGSLYRFMGQAAEELDRLGQAVNHYQKAVEIDSRDVSAIDRLARLHFGQGRYAEAHRLYSALVEIQPDSAQTNSNLGAALYHLGRTADAIRSFERALSLDPTLEAARTGLEQLRTKTPRPPR